MNEPIELLIPREVIDGYMAYKSLIKLLDIKSVGHCGMLHHPSEEYQTMSGIRYGSEGHFLLGALEAFIRNEERLQREFLESRGIKSETTYNVEYHDITGDTEDISRQVQ